jgi:hypothetical protein
VAIGDHWHLNEPKIEQTKTKIRILKRINRRRSILEFGKEIAEITHPVFLLRKIEFNLIQIQLGVGQSH